MARNVEQEQAVNFVTNCISRLYNGVGLGLPELSNQVVQDQQSGRAPVALNQSLCLVPRSNRFARAVDEVTLI